MASTSTKLILFFLLITPLRVSSTLASNWQNVWTSSFKSLINVSSSCVKRHNSGSGWWITLLVVEKLMQASRSWKKNHIYWILYKEWNKLKTYFLQDDVQKFDWYIKSQFFLMRKSNFLAISVKKWYFSSLYPFHIDS